MRASGVLSIGARTLTLRERIFVTFDDPSSSGLARSLSISSLVLIIISVFALVCETVFTVPPDGCGACEPAQCVDNSDPFDPQPVEWCLTHCGSCEPTPSPFFFWLDCLLIPIFTLEYLLQLGTVHNAECVDTEALVTGADAGWDELENADDSAATAALEVARREATAYFK